jgi:hypothetical protein
VVILNALRIYLEVGEHREHFDQVEQILRHTSRSVLFMFIPKPLTRWHVPQLSGFVDIGLWVANDYPVTFDVTKLWYKAKSAGMHAVYLMEDERYERRPNLMFFRNKFCDRLTSEYIYTATPDQLDPVVWAGGQNNIGTIKVDHAGLSIPMRK